MSLVEYTTKLVEGLEPLKQLIPARGLAIYVGSCCKRLIEPHILTYEARQEAKRQQGLFKDFPLKRIEMCEAMMKSNAMMLPEATMESFANAMKIGDFCLGYINGDKESLADACGISIDDEWLNRFIDNAKYVSDEDLQRVWGRLLKEKICNPEKVNKRVLSFLCNLDLNELKTIEENLSYFKLGDVPSEALEDNDKLLNIIIRLMGLGLVYTYSSASHNYEITNTILFKPEDPVLILGDYELEIIGLDKEIRVDYSGYHLSTEGEIICGLIDQPLPHVILDTFTGMVKKKLEGKYEVELRKVK